jgi:hypothetical protein
VTWKFSSTAAETLLNRRGRSNPSKDASLSMKLLELSTVSLVSIIVERNVRVLDVRVAPFR